MKPAQPIGSPILALINELAAGLYARAEVGVRRAAEHESLFP